LNIAVDLSDIASQVYSATPTRAGTTAIGTSRASTKPFNGRLDDLRLYVGVAAESVLCTTYLNPSNCG
jgi:hypothetical protein